jgi:predicted GNAT family acetyltransferase
MDINELESFKMSDAVKFHKELNPKLWEDHKLDPEVRDQLLLIAEDFVEYLGLSNLKVKDVTISGSNAAYSYTPHSDLDLHVLVDFNELPNNEVYQELFTAKKTLYNDAHDITVRDVPVELYVQDTNNPVHSLGEYSIVHDKWIRIPKKRKANYDEAATKAKYEKLGDLIELALKTRDPKRVKDTLALIKRYRKSGLEKTGEFGPENLAFKAVRKQGLIQDLHDLKAKLHAEKLSIDEYANEDYDPNGPPPGPEFKPTMPAGTVKVDVSDVYDWYKLGQHISNMKGLGKHDFGKGPPSTILSFGDEDTEHKYIQDLEKTGLTTTDIDPVDPNQPKGMKRQKTDPTYKVDEAETANKKAAVLKIQKHLNKKYGANLDLDGILGPLTLKSINKFMPRAKKGLADEPNKTTRVQGKKVKVKEYVDDIKSYRNPSPKTLYNLTKRSAHKHMRGMYHNGDTYWWDANDAIHADGSKLLGIPYDYLNRLEAAIDNVSGNYYVGGDDGVPTEITQRYDVEELAESSGITFTQEPYEGWNGMGAMITAYADGDQVGQVIFEPTDSDKNKWYATEVEVEDDFQRRGIATTMYDMAKKIAQKANAVIVPSHAQTSDAKGLWKNKKVWEASGYIPSEKEKNDPRFKTALTVDVKPDSIKKNAKAFGWKTSRAGIPPQANPSGKIAEDLMREFKSFLLEDKQPKVGYHVTATKNLPVIRKNGIKADRRGNSYVWDSLEMAEWFTDFQNDEGQDRTILKIDMSGIDARPDPEAEDMSEWSSSFEPGTNGGAWIVSGPIPPDKIIG